MKRLPTILLCALCALALLPAAASARGLFGVVMDPDLAASPASTIDQQTALMHRSGVQWLRVDFDWNAVEPVRGAYSWNQTDTIVRSAARHGIKLMPIVEFTPQWASSHPQSAWAFYAPTSDALYGDFLKTLIGRYGPHGSFWAQNPGVPHDPIRAWQIWNEPEGTRYDWRSTPWQKTYMALLKAAYPAVHHADPGAKVVSGAVVALGCHRCLPQTEAADLYKLGFKRYFDVLGFNLFTLNPTSVSGTVNYLLKVVSWVHAVMARNHDGGKPIWITELTWTAAKGRIPHQDLAGFETTPKGQAQRITAFYTELAKHHPFNIQRAFWYDWASTYSPQPEYPGAAITFQYSGLLKWAPGQVFTPQPGLAAYSKVAHRYAGA